MNGTAPMADRAELATRSRALRLVGIGTPAPTARTTQPPDRTRPKGSPMSDHAQGFGDWREEHHRRAQAHAFVWAERATTEYGQAVSHENDALARQNADSAWQRDRMNEERRQAQFHGTRCTEALKLAEMWARVAQGLAVGELPFTAVLETTAEPTSDGTAP